jgi:hypothetical protein
MRFLSRRLVLFLCIVVPSALIDALPTLAAEPHVEIKGLQSASAGVPLYLDVSGTVSDKPLKVRTTGPEQPGVRTWYDAEQRPGLIEITFKKPGTYILIVLATGKVDSDSEVDFQPWSVVVGGTAPPPVPPPPAPPGPTPPDPTPPGPTPPGPAPVAGTIYGLYVVPDPPSVGEAQLRTSPNIRAAFKANSASFSSYLATQDVIQQNPAWMGMIQAAGGPPCVLWFDASGNPLRASKVADESTFLNDLRALRGAK